MTAGGQADRMQRCHRLTACLQTLRVHAQALPARAGEEVAIKQHLCGLLDALVLLTVPGRGEHLSERTLDRIATAVQHLDALLAVFASQRAVNGS